MTTTFARRLTLWKLLSAATEPLSVADIAGRLGVSKNTAQRDLDALSQAGVPVVEERRGQRLFFRIAATAAGPAPGPAPAPAPGRRPQARPSRRSR